MKIISSVVTVLLFAAGFYADANGNTPGNQLRNLGSCGAFASCGLPVLDYKLNLA